MRVLSAILAAVLATAAGAAAKTQVGIALPYLGADYGSGGPNACLAACVAQTYFGPAALQYFQAIGVSFVRTGWIPAFFVRANRAWRFMDPEMASICTSGLKIAVLVPGMDDVPKPPLHPDVHWGIPELADNVRTFFARYAPRYPHCFLYAELGNEADLPQNGYAGVDDYAAYYEAIAPIPKSFGIPVVTAGTSGLDLPWISRLATLLAAAGAPVDAYGYHPYGVVANTGAPRGTVTDSIAAVAAAAGVKPSRVYVTELGMKTGPQLQWGLIQSAAVSPYVAVYTYYVFPPGTDATYSLAAHPALMQGFKDGVAAIAEEEPAP